MKSSTALLRRASKSPCLWSVTRSRSTVPSCTTAVWPTVAPFSLHVACNAECAACADARSCAGRITQSGGATMSFVALSAHEGIMGTFA